MNFLRLLLFDNLGLKFMALLLSVLVYFNARTDRPVTMVVSFPIAFQDLPDSLTVSGPAPAEVRAEIRGTGKAVIALRLNRPPLQISLARVGNGQFQRSVRPSDLPLPRGLEVERLLGPRMLTLEIDRKARRRVPVAARLDWANGASAERLIGVTLDPPTVLISGPARVVSRVDTVTLAPFKVDGRRDTVRAEVGAQELPERITMEPSLVRVTAVVTRQRT